MVRTRQLIVITIALLWLSMAPSEGATDKQKKVKCRDSRYPECSKKENMYCPESCPRDCYADCGKCEATCPPSLYSPPPPPKLFPVPQYSPPPPPPDTSEAAGGRRVRCRRPDFPACYNVQHTCPPACPNQCQVDCGTCSPVCECNRPGAVCQDPRFVGGDGLTFYFHGKKDNHFCLVSDANLHINAHFIGKPGPKPGSRDFTWVSSLGVLFGSGHNLSISALPTASWDDSVDRLSISLDGSPVTLGSRSEFRSATVPPATFRRPATEDVNSVEVEVEGVLSIRAKVVPITAEDSRIHNYGIVDGVDCFAHLDVSFRFFSLSDDVDGVLGRTYGPGYVSKAKMGVAMPVLGGNREFATTGLFNPDCAAAKYASAGDQASPLATTNVGVMNCGGGGVGGRGVVCRR